MITGYHNSVHSAPPSSSSAAAADRHQHQNHHQQIVTITTIIIITKLVITIVVIKTCLAKASIISRQLLPLFVIIKTSQPGFDDNCPMSPTMFIHIYSFIHTVIYTCTVIKLEKHWTLLFLVQSIQKDFENCSLMTSICLFFWWLEKVPNKHMLPNGSEKW